MVLFGSAASDLFRERSCCSKTLLDPIACFWILDANNETLGYYIFRVARIVSHISVEPLASATNLEYVQRNHSSKESESSRRQADLEVCVCRNLPLLVWPMFFHRFRVMNMKSIARLKSIVSPPRRRSNYPRSFGTGSETQRAWPSCLKMLKVLNILPTHVNHPAWLCCMATNVNYCEESGWLDAICHSGLLRVLRAATATSSCASVVLRTVWALVAWCHLQPFNK